MALLTNYFRCFPLLHCGVHPHCLFWNMTVYFCFISEFSQLLFYLFLFCCLPLSILGFYFFLRIVSSYLNWLVEEFKFSSECYSPVFFNCVYFFVVEKGGIPERLVGLLCLISLWFLSDPWFFFSVFSFCYCVAKGMYSSLIYCQKLCFSKADPLSYLVFKSPTLTCFQYVGIPLYCCGHNFCLVSSKFLVPLYSFSVLHKPFSSYPQTRLPVEGNSAGIWLGFPWQTIWRLCYSLYC